MNGVKVRKIFFTRGGFKLEEHAIYFRGLERPAMIEESYRTEEVPRSLTHPTGRQKVQLGVLCSAQPKRDGAIWTLVNEPHSDSFCSRADGIVDLRCADSSVVSVSPDGTATWKDAAGKLIAVLGADGKEHWTQAQFESYGQADSILHYEQGGASYHPLSWQDDAIVQLAENGEELLPATRQQVTTSRDDDSEVEEIPSHPSIQRIFRA